MIIFRINDKTNREIRLTKIGWKHISREHPKINIEEIKNTLTSPDIIKPSIYDPKNVKWYYKFDKNKKRYIMVSVKYLNNEGFIITAFYVNRIR